MRNKAFDNLIKALCVWLITAMLFCLTACDESNIKGGNSSIATQQSGEQVNNTENNSNDAGNNSVGGQNGQQNDEGGIEGILEFNEGPKVTIETADATYELKKDLKTYLFIGIDDPRTVTEQIEQIKYRPCDTIILFVVDDANKKYSILPINRDTIVTIDTLDPYGNIVARTEEQLAFAYSYTIDPLKNCENVARTVSRMLGGIPIDGYAVLSYSALPALNDAVGGVTVTLEDDFTQTKLGLEKGETITLQGDQAITFIRQRWYVGDGHNPGRMRRHQQYIDAFTKQVKAKMKDNSSIINDLYYAAQPYMVSNMSSGTMINTAAKCMGYASRTYSLSGTSEDVTYSAGVTNAEFTVDKASVDKTVLELFYVKR